MENEIELVETAENAILTISELNTVIELLPDDMKCALETVCLIKERWADRISEEVMASLIQFMALSIAAYCRAAAEESDERGSIVQGVLGYFIHFQQTHLSFLPEDEQPLMFLPHQQREILPDGTRGEVEQRTGAISEASMDRNTNVETTGKQVTTDDLDALFADIDELLEENDEDEQDTGTDSGNIGITESS